MTAGAHWAAYTDTPVAEVLLAVLALVLAAVGAYRAITAPEGAITRLVVAAVLALVGFGICVLGSLGVFS